MFNRIIFLTILFSSLFVPAAFAEVDAEIAYIFNTFSFLVCGFLVMWMAAGFCMLESGLVTTRSVSTIAAKNIGLTLLQLKQDTQMLRIGFFKHYSFVQLHQLCQAQLLKELKFGPSLYSQQY